MKPSKVAFLTLLGLALLLFAYGNSFSNQFHFADMTAIVENPGLSLPYSLSDLISRSDISNTDPQYQRYQPLNAILLIANRSVGGIQPYPYRWTSFLLFCGLIVSLWALMRRLDSIHSDGPSGSKALLASAIFALSAVQAETINYITARSSMIAALGMAWSLFLFSGRSSGRRHKLYLLPLAAAAMHSELVVAFPFLLALYIAVFGAERNEPLSHLLRRAFCGVIPALLVTAGFTALSFMLSNPASLHLGSWEAAALFPYATLLYFISFLYPFAISASPSLSSGPAQEQLAALCGVIFFCALLAVAVAALRERRLKLLGFALAWFVLCTLPQILITSESNALFDYRRALFAYAGLAFAAAQGLGIVKSSLAARQRWGSRARSAALLCALVLLSCHVLMIRQRNRVWSSEDSLWFDVLRHNPTDGKALMHYGASKMQRGDTDIARIYFEEALTRLPNEPALYEKLGTLHGIMTLDERVAEKFFDKALALDDARPETYASYARWLYDRKRYEAAVPAAHRAIQLNPRDATPYYTLLDAYNRLGLWSKVVETAQALLRISPEDPVAQRLLAQADERIRQRKHSQ